MVPARMQNGTDLADGAARCRRAAAPRAEHVRAADAAARADRRRAARQSGRRRARPRARRRARARAHVAAFVVRPSGDDPPGREARQALSDFAASRRGVARVLRPAEVADAVTGALADIDRGGDVAGLRAKVDGRQYTLAPSLAPDTVVAGVMSSAGKPPARHRDRGRRSRQAHRRCRAARCACAPEWLRAWSTTARPAREAAPAGVAGAARAGRADRPLRPRAGAGGQGIDGSPGDAQRAVARVHAARARLLPQPHRASTRRRAI